MAYAFPVPEVWMPRHHIDFPPNSLPKHWFGPECSVTPPKFDPKGTRDFFEEARHRQDGNLKHSVHFNIIKYR